MPTSLSVFPNTSKSIKLTALLLLSPLFFFGQTLTGLWTGALSNDSTTIRKDQSFEIALTEYKGKVYGYSRSEFIVDDTLFYVMKRVKGTIDGDVCEVTDDEIVSYNFRGKLDKGVKVVSTFRRNKNDSTWYLDGTWKTNATKKYYSVTGKVNLAEEKDLAASKIFPHLEELNLADDVAFYKERQQTTSVARMIMPEKIKTEYSTKLSQYPKTTDVAITITKPTLERAETKPAPVLSVDEPVKTDVATITAAKENSTSITATENKEEEISTIKKPIADIAQKEIKKVDAGSVALTPVSVNKTVAQNKVPVVTTTPEKTSVDIATNKEPNIQTAATAAVKNPLTTQPATITDIKITKAEPVTKTTAIRQIPPAVTPIDNPKQTQAEIKTVVKTNNPVTTKPVIETKKQDIIPTAPVKTVTLAVTTPVPEKKGVKTEPAVVASVVAAVVPETKKPEADILAKAAVIGGRKSEFSQIVSFKSDSLELSLYDNGEVDGDTVSVFMNGEVIMARQGLKSSAIKKTIYITKGNEDFTLVLFADNLGKYPPNTGLLVVHDGEDVYNLRFSSDFQKSSGIVFKRKK